MQNTPLRHARVQAVAQARLQRLGIYGHPGLRFSTKVEGYKDYVFGARAGPSVSTINLFHELAHAAQFGPEEFRKRNLHGFFGFKMRKVEVLGQVFDEPLTCSATERELSTFAHQLHLMRLAGCKIDARAFFAEAILSMVFVPDWINVPGANDQERHDYCIRRTMDMFDRLSPQESLDRLIAWLDLTKRDWRETTQIDLFDSRWQINYN